MKPLILTSSSSRRMRSELADVVIDFRFRFVPGTLPPPDELATYVAARSDKHGPAEHWSDFVGRWPRGDRARRDFGLLEFCQPYESIELWFDPEPNDQLQQIWLLDHFRSDPETAAKLKLRLVDFDLITMEYGPPENLEEVRVVDVTAAKLETAGMSWQAYRATTPEACFDLLHRDLSEFPWLRPALLDLLEELPSRTTGLSATEMRLLELIAAGYSHPNALFFDKLRQRGVFNDTEIGSLLEGLAHAPRPAVAGLDDELRVLGQENHRGRTEAFRRSRLSLTEFGEAILAHEEDFSRHNPIDRWWGGTHLTDDRLWRWGSLLMKPQSSGGQ